MKGDALGTLTAAERDRVAALLIADGQWHADDQLARLSDTTGRRRIRPSSVVAERRTAQSNGMPEQECTDTIGRLWAWGCLDGARFASDLLRDAGRRYAAAYWFRYGPVCGHVGAYSDMTRASGRKVTVITDEAKDVIAEYRFQARDRAICRLGITAKRLVDQICVDGNGDNDPGWLIELMSGYQADTRQERALYEQRKLECGVGAPDVQRRKLRLADDARRKLANTLREIRSLRLPPARLGIIRDGLVELADVDRLEGLHKPKRHSLIVCDPA